MSVFTTVEELRRWSRKQHADGKCIGIVPTMGALHEGHLSLVRRANEQCGGVVVSIFVNPAQFAPNEDFHKYPRPLENDLALLKSAGNPAVFVPSVEEMYPAGFDSAVHIGGVSLPFEGRLRPAHFDGVATVVLKLFSASEADCAFFGQKDFQQCCVVRKMVNELNLPIKIVVCPIVREECGLAMSSRNRYLSEEQRRQSVVLSQSVSKAQQLIEKQRVRDIPKILEEVRSVILSAPDMHLDYASIADTETLQELTDFNGVCEAVLLLAARIGTTRLLDNGVIKIS
ncbi:pantothenate synthetase [Planctomycetales bacterium]|nr:pantothenate synthetase [Planctomycetales bacterium]